MCQDKKKGNFRFWGKWPPSYWYQILLPLFNNGIVEVAIFVDNKLTLASVLGHFRLVWAHEELALEQLHSNDGEHENQEQRNQYDVTNGFDGNYDTLNDMLETFGSVDGTERTKNT